VPLSGRRVVQVMSRIEGENRTRSQLEARKQELDHERDARIARARQVQQGVRPLSFVPISPGAGPHLRRHCATRACRRVPLSRTGAHLRPHLRTHLRRDRPNLCPLWTCRDSRAFQELIVVNEKLNAALEVKAEMSGRLKDVEGELEYVRSKHDMGVEMKSEMTVTEVR
jgi:hypothetical protein